MTSGLFSPSLRWWHHTLLTVALAPLVLAWSLKWEDPGDCLSIKGPHVACAHCVHSAGLPDTCVTGGQQVCCLERAQQNRLSPCGLSTLRKLANVASESRQAASCIVRSFLTLNSCPHVQWTTCRSLKRKTRGIVPYTVYAGVAMHSHRRVLAPSHTTADFSVQMHEHDWRRTVPIEPRRGKNLCGTEQT